jgi:hypothetical protein
MRPILCFWLISIFSGMVHPNFAQVKAPEPAVGLAQQEKQTAPPNSSVKPMPAAQIASAPGETSSIASTVATVKDAIAALAAAAAIVVAFMGLNTWKRQLHGNTKYDLARRLLRATYRLREAIRYVRTPMISVGEIAAARKATGLPDEPEPGEETGKNDEVTYQARWQKIYDARVEFDAEMLEAEVLLSPIIKTKADALRMCVGELHGNLYRWLGKHELLEGDFKKVRGIVYDLADYDSEFSDKVNAAISAIEIVVKPHLKA